MEIIKKLSNYSEAQIVKSFLIANDIEAQIYDSNMMSVEPHLALVLGGFRIAVPGKQAFMARELLKEVEEETSTT